MSSTFLKIIPTNPSFEPGNETLAKAKKFLTSFYSSEQIEFIITPTIEFVDQGQNFENVSCNLCRQVIEVKDWQNVMDAAYEHQFTDLKFISLCCKKESSLNDLSYEKPAGFAKFVVCISDAQNELAKSEQLELQNILGTTLRVISARY